jgi:glycosyltransferase involved in cell wall biosynthesis
MNQPQISVIIPTYHRNDLLAKCLDCLAPGVQVLPAEQYEVIVTDDGSKTTAKEMILECYPWVKWVGGPRKGPGANRNNGAQYAQGEWLAFTDDDCLPEPNWLSAFAEATTGSAQALEGAIHPLGDVNQDLAECPVNVTGGAFLSANIAVARSLFEKIGGFDPNYPLALHEDTDIYLRLSEFTTIPFVAEARVLHPVRVISLKQKITRIPKQSAATAYHLNKHKKAMGYKNALSLTVFQFKFNLGWLLRELRYLNFKSVCDSFFWVVIGTPLLLIYLLRAESTLTQVDPDHLSRLNL